MGSRELCELWVFADKYEVPVLQSLAIDALHENLGQFALHKTDIAFVYDNTDTKSKLRALLVDKYAMIPSIKSVFTTKDEFPKTFLFDVLRRIGEDMGTRPNVAERWRTLNFSLYHERLYGCY